MQEGATINGMDIYFILCNYNIISCRFWVAAVSSFAAGTDQRKSECFFLSSFNVASCRSCINLEANGSVSAPKLYFRCRKRKNQVIKSVSTSNGSTSFGQGGACRALLSLQCTLPSKFLPAPTFAELPRFPVELLARTALPMHAPSSLPLVFVMA